MKKLVILSLGLALLLIGFVSAVCTDYDGDGYYTEGECSIEGVYIYENPPEDVCGLPDIVTSDPNWQWIGTAGIIDGIKFGDIETSNGEADYTDYTSLEEGFKTIVEKGQTYTLTIKEPVPNPAYNQKAHVYFDWDGDGNFNDETKIEIGTIGWGMEATKEITIPNNAVFGPIRMRVVLGVYCTGGYGCNILSPCSGGDVNDVDDYSVFVVESGFSYDETDCDDSNPDVNPGEEEVCGDGLDNDCVGGDEICAEPPEHFTCSDETQIILRLSAHTNAHAEVWNGIGDYPVEICYDEIFGITYTGINPHSCTKTNKIVGLSQDSVEIWFQFPEEWIGKTNIDVCDTVTGLTSLGYMQRDPGGDEFISANCGDPHANSFIIGGTEWDEFKFFYSHEADLIEQYIPIVYTYPHISNAHAEIPSLDNYALDVCYGDLVCTARDSCLADEECVVALSDDTNANLETCEQDNYNVKICCKSENSVTPECTGDGDCGTDGFIGDAFCQNDDVYQNYREFTCSGGTCSNSTTAHLIESCDHGCLDGECISVNPIAFWSINGDTEIQDLEVYIGTTSVLMVLKNSGLSEGTSVSFEIFENDLDFGTGLLDDDIRVGADALVGEVDADGNVQVSWTPTEEDITAADDEDLYHFYFQVEGTESQQDLRVTIAEIDPCVGKSLCMHYTDQSTCEADTCTLGPVSVETNDPDIVCGNITQDEDECDIWTECGCEWDEDEETCGPLSTEMRDTDSCEGHEGEPGVIGSCDYDETTSDTCDDDGFLDYSWIGDWIWGEDNIFSSNMSGDEDYIEQPLGTWRFDPDRKYQACILGGENRIPCPAQIELSVFGILGFFSSLLIIGVIYIVFGRKNLSC